MNSCPLCSSEIIKDFLKFKNFTYKKCLNCTLVFLDIKEESSETEVEYDYEYVIQRGHNLFDSSIARAKQKTYLHYLSKIEKLIFEKPSLLEIGCSTGITLKVAQERDWKVCGLEINERAAEIARNYLNEDIVSGNLKPNLFNLNQFSAIIMIDLIEHINNPVEFLSIINGILKRDGIIFIITPNSDSLSFKMLRTKWHHLFLEHIFLYSPKSIELLLKNHKFEIIEIKRAKKFLSLEMVKKHFECHPHSFLAKNLLTIIRILPTVVREFVFPLFYTGELYVIARKI